MLIVFKQEYIDMMHFELFSVVLTHYNYEGICIIVVFKTSSRREFVMVRGHLLYLNKDKNDGRVLVKIEWCACQYIDQIWVDIVLHIR